MLELVVVGIRIIITFICNVILLARDKIRCLEIGKIDEEGGCEVGIGDGPGLCKSNRRRFEGICKPVFWRSLCKSDKLLNFHRSKASDCNWDPIHVVQSLFRCEYSTGSCSTTAKAGLPGLLPTLGLGPGRSQQNANFPSLHSGFWGWLNHCRTSFTNSGIPWKSCMGLTEGIGMSTPEGMEMSTPPSPLSIKKAVSLLSSRLVDVERSNWGFGERLEREGFNAESAK